MAMLSSEPNVADTRGRRRPRSARSPKDGHFGQASWVSSNVNLINTIIGAGTLAMPLALSHMGITLGTIVILWSGLTAAFGLYLQTRCTRYVERGTASFDSLAAITFPSAAILFNAAIAIKCFGVGVSYLIIIGDLMPGVVRGLIDDADAVPVLVNRHFWITLFMLVVIPLSFLRRLDSLRYTSMIALVSISYLVVLVVYHFVEGDTMADRGPIRVFKWGSLVETLQSFPVIVFAYTCHQNMFAVLNEIKDNSQRRTTSVVATSIGTAAIVYVVVAITGYLSFGNSIKGNIVGMYVPSLASTIAKAAIVVLVMFSYPMQVHPCRASVDAVLKKVTPEILKGARPQNASPSRSALLPSASGRSVAKNEPAIPELRFAIITTGIIILSYIGAMTLSSLDRVLAYVGSTGSTSISFILPGFFYWKISAPDSPHHQKLTKEDDDENVDEEEQGLLGQQGAKSLPWQKTILRKFSLALGIYGIFVMILCLGTNMFFTASAH